MKSEVKDNAQGTNSDGKETGTRINDLEQKEESKHSNGSEWRNKNSKKWGEAKKLWDIFKYSNIQIIEVPEEEEEEQDIENLFENIIKENFPNLAKEIDFHEVQEAQRVPKM